MSAIAEKPRKKRVSAFSHRKVDPAYYWMTVPAMILFMVFLYWPFLRGVMYSFTNSKGYGKYKWIGLTNYKAMFQDERIGRAYLFTFFIAIVVTILVNLLSMFIAVLLNSKIAFRNGFRAIYFIPYTLAVLVVGYVFKYIFMMPIPELGKALGIGWLSESMITSESLAYEAAALDGVNAWQKFWQITFPLIGPFFTINLVLTMKGALGTFDQVVALTGGGPNSATETVTYLIYQGGLTGGEYAYQTANAVMFFIVLAIIAFIQLKFFGSKEKV